jgi:urate oxidase
VKELEVSTRLTLSSRKDYLKGDNSDIVATDSQKNIVYLLAKKYGIKSPEDFGTLLCNHFMSTYDHVVKTSVRIEEVMWNRVNYGDHANVKLHNHAFIHTPICTRSASVVLKRGGKTPASLFNCFFFSIYNFIFPFLSFSHSYMQTHIHVSLAASKICAF